MSTQRHPTTFSELSELPKAAFVRVVLAAGEASARTSEEVLDPKSFGSFADYRAALIQSRQQQTRFIKSIIEEKARALGLNASSARSLNAVTVEGSAGRILKLIRQVHPKSVVLEQGIMSPAQPQTF
ncbi:MAG: hypothetical protein IPO08_05100 [Xanthomonadales bacterium]|nr:hypothetical protein [Xanthomonadales bacterium]